LTVVKTSFFVRDLKWILDSKLTHILETLVKFETEKPLYILR